MIHRKHHPFFVGMFRLLTHLLLKRCFHQVHHHGSFIDHGQSVLVLSNHISWWDGFWMLHLNTQVFKKKMHFMMLETQLRKHWYFQFIGGYSVKKHSKSMVESLLYTVELLRHSQNMVFLFPQGKIQSLYQSSIHFDQGVYRIFRALSPRTQIVFAANFVDYLSEKKPTWTVYYEQFSVADLIQDDLAEKYNLFYRNALGEQQSKFSS